MEDFLRFQERKNALKLSKVFGSFNDREQNMLALSMTEISLKPGEVVLRQDDDKEKDVFVVKDGTLECFDPSNPEKVLLTVTRGGQVGDVAFLEGQPQPTSVRVPINTPTKASGCLLWKIDQELLESVFGPRKRSKSFALSALEQDSDYAKFVDAMERKRAIMSLPFLSEIEKTEMEHLVDALELVPIETDEIIIQKGSVGRDMYIVKSGEYVSYLEEEKQECILKTYTQRGDYFGELGLFFERPRAAFVRCTKSGEVWSLSREKLFDALTETSIGPEVYNLIQDLYRQDSWLQKATQLSLQDWYDLAVVQSRPKKKPISIHSLLATIASSAALLMMVPLVDPKLHGPGGYPQIFSINSGVSMETVTQSQVVSVLMSISSVLGLLRLPVSSPDIRRIGMSISASTVVIFSLIDITILSGDTNNYLIDIFSPFGRVAMAAVGGWVCKDAFDLMYCILADREMKGFESVPGMENRWIATSQGLFQVAATFAKLYTVLPAFGDRSEFENYALPYLATNPLAQSTLPGLAPGTLSAGSAIIASYVGLSSFLGTVLFEKKISEAAALALYFVGSVVFLFDTVEVVLVGTFCKDQFQSDAAKNYLSVYLPKLLSDTHFLEIYVGVFAIVLCRGLWELVSNRRRSHATGRLGWPPSA